MITSMIFFLVMASAVMAQVPSIFLTASVTPNKVTGDDIRGGISITLTVTTRSGVFGLADVVTASHLKEEHSNPLVGLVYFASGTFNNGFNDLCAKRPTLSLKSPMVSEVKRVSPSTVTLLLSATDYNAYEAEEIYFQFLLPAFRTNLTNGPIAVKVAVTEELASIAQVGEVVSVVCAYITLIISYFTTLAGAPISQVLIFSKLSYFARIDTCSNRLDYVLHMSQISVLPDLTASVFYYAALVMNMSIFMAVFIIHWVFLICAGSKARNSVYFFPASHFYTAAFASGGIAVGAIDLIITSPTPLRFVLGVVCACVFYSGIFTALCMLSNQCLVVKPASVRPLSSPFCYNFAKAYGNTIFAHYKPEASCFIVVEVLEVMLLGALSAMPPTTPGPQGCQGKAGGTIAVLGVYFLILVIIRPHRHTMSFVFWMLVQAWCIVIAIFTLWQTFDSAVNRFAEIVAEFLNIGVCVIVLLRAVMSIWYKPSTQPSSELALGAPFVDTEMHGIQNDTPLPLVPNTGYSQSSPWSHGVTAADGGVNRRLLPMMAGPPMMGYGQQEYRNVNSGEWNSGGGY